MTQGFYEQLGVELGASAGQIRQAFTAAVARLQKRRKALVEQGGDTAAIDLARAQLDEAMAVLSDPLRRRRYDAMLSWGAAPPVDAGGRRTSDPDALWRHVSDALVHPAAAAAVRLLRATTQLGVAEIAAPPSAGDEPPTLVPADEDLTSPRMPKRLGTPAPAVRSSPGVRTSPGLRAQPTMPPSAIPATPFPSEAPTSGGARVRSVVPAPPERPSTPTADRGSVVPLPGLRTAPTPAPALRVVESAPPVVMMPEPPRPEAPRTEPPRSEAPRPRRVEKPVSAEDIARLVDTYGYTGQLLRSVREARGLTVQELSETTRISVRYLEAIEGDGFDALPSSTFVRGYVREMARLLKLDEAAVVNGYMRRLQD